MRNLLLAVIVYGICAGHLAWANETRVALVIGNNAYKEAPLTAPINDARAMQSTLAGLGFKVSIAENVKRLDMLRMIRAFVDASRGTEVVGLLYFAGHGIQARGKNFLIPIDADVDNEDDVEFQGVDVQYILDKFSEAGQAINLLILDACRNNPFSRLSVRRAGLASVDGPPGTLVAFAAAPGQVAIEKDGDHGIFTKHILNNIATPGIPIEEIFKRVIILR